MLKSILLTATAADARGALALLAGAVLSILVSGQGATVRSAAGAGGSSSFVALLGQALRRRFRLLSRSA